MSSKKITDKQKEALRILRKYKQSLERQQIRTLKGQILAGDPDGALKGLRRTKDEDQRP